MNRRNWKGEKVKGIDIRKVGKKKEKPTKPAQPWPKSSPSGRLPTPSFTRLWVSGTEKTTSGCEGVIGTVDADSVADV